MSGYRRVNYYELCRLCTSNKGTKVHLFKEEGKRRQIPTKIQICLRLQVSEQDSLPKLICNLCLEKLEGYFDFRSNCVNAEAMLESYAKNLSLNNDFVMDGKVYIKENKLDNVEEENATKEVIINATQGGTTLQLKESEIKVPSQQNEIVTLPVSLDNLGGLVQAATIHILPEKELAKLQGNLKSTIQVQQNVERITGEHSYSYNIQEQSFGEESSNQKREQNVIKTAVTTSTQMDKTEIIPQTTDVMVDATQDKCRNSISQIGEFLKLKTVSTNEEERGDCRCENCGIMFTSLIEKSTHSDGCTTVDDQLKISEPVVMVDVQEDRNPANCGPFTCDDCGKIFRRKEHLVQHKRLHTGERPFRCSQCPSAFSRKEHLARHVVCHTGEKHYSCGICGKLFGRKDNVGKHLRTHQVKTLLISDSTSLKTTCSDTEDSSTTLIQKCSLCDKNFQSPEQLRKHISLRHSDTDKCNIMVINTDQPVSILEKALKQIPG